MNFPPITFVQCNPLVGDISGNAERIRHAYDKAAREKAALVVFPECALIGYGTEDLLLRSAFQQRAMEEAHKLARHTQGKETALLLGSLWLEEERLTNAALWMEQGRITQVRHKYELPNEGVFDEWRVFQPGPLPEIIRWRDHRLGVMICADLWHRAVPAHLGNQGADLFLVLNASPYEPGKDAKRKALAEDVATTYGAPVIYLNLCGGQDELVFDGGSFCVDASGALIRQFPYFAEHHASFPFTHSNISPVPDDDELTYNAMMTGLRDYVHKSGFTDIVLGLSGGIDSGLSAAVAVDALGASHVRTVMLPSPYTADISLEDAQALAGRLGVRYEVAPITQAMHTLAETISPLETPDGLTAENLQSRLRGLMLMAISNASGALLLTTGNKSELATGYATLYGDMCGAYSVLKDVYKTDVFALSRWRNAHLPHSALGPSGSVIPNRMISRPPSAELRADQTDQDSLPPYEILDGILRLLIEGRAGKREIIDAGYDAATVLQVIRLLKRSEYKRSQAPIGVKLTTMSFGRDWRYPLASGYDFE